MLLVGAGGHAKVVLDTLLKQSKSLVVVDSDVEKHTKSILGHEILPLDLTVKDNSFHIAIGSNAIREKLFLQLRNENTFTSVISDEASIADSSKIGDGVFVAKKTVLAADSRIGSGVIINHGAVVEHDCEVGDFCHVAPNATLLGNVKLQEKVFIGAGSVVLPGISIAANTIIGAGSVVTKNIEIAAVYIGAPAKKLR